MNCPECQSAQILKNGKARLQNHRSLQQYVCKACGKQFNERTGTPMSRLRSTPESLSLALLCAQKVWGCGQPVAY